MRRAPTTTLAQSASRLFQDCQFLTQPRYFTQESEFFFTLSGFSFSPLVLSWDDFSFHSSFFYREHTFNASTVEFFLICLAIFARKRSLCTAWMIFLYFHIHKRRRAPTWVEISNFLYAIQERLTIHQFCTNCVCPSFYRRRRGTPTQFEFVFLICLNCLLLAYDHTEKVCELAT